MRSHWSGRCCWPASCGRGSNDPVRAFARHRFHFPRGCRLSCGEPGPDRRSSPSAGLAHNFGLGDFIMKGLAFFRRTNSARCWTIAAFHSPHSLTWSWILSFSCDGFSERRFWPLIMPYRTNQGLQCVIRIPYVGIFNWHRQQPKWFRDLYHRLRDEQDGLDWRPSDEPPPAPPSRLTVIDGGQSVH